MSRRKAAPTNRRQTAAPVLPVDALDTLEVIHIRLERARQILHCLEFAATANADVELGPVAFVAVELIDRVLEGLTQLGIKHNDRNAERD